MDERRCALCGEEREDYLTQYFVTVDVVDDLEGEMLGGELQYHKLYVCDQCRGEEGEEEEITFLSDVKSTVLYPWIIGGAALLIVGGLSLIFPFVWKWSPFAWLITVFTLQISYQIFKYRRIQAKLQKIALDRHGGEGSVRVFTPDQFKVLQRKIKRKQQ